MKRIQMTMCLVFVVCCGLFGQAQVTGSGTTNYLPLWTGSSTLGNSRFYQNGGNMGLNTTSPQNALDVNGHINSSEGYLIGESLVLTTPGGSASGNVALGADALYSTTGSVNTAIGQSALQNNINGSYNTAVGNIALSENTSGFFDTAVGYGSLLLNTTSTYNTAVGADALTKTPGDGNTVVGAYAGALVTGAYNTLLGNFAGYYTGSIGLTGGSYNIAIGNAAGENLDNGNSNIDIGNSGVSGDSGAVRIGTSGQHTSFFAAGIRGVTTGENNAVEVVIDSNGQLGTVSSSRRFKTDIQDMGEASRGLLRLRPVTFRYRKPYADGSQPMQYGLIAEEVAEVYPDLVAYGNDGQPESVKYQLLDSLLLNEVQHQQAEIQDLREKLTRIESLLSSTPLAAQAQTTREVISETTVAKSRRQ